jgi:predicted AlkP superfamily pyrophosphatase or phosphodiesterase
MNRKWNRRLFLSIVLLVPLLAFGLCPTAFAQDGNQTNIVLIGWDGCRRDVLKEMIARKELPAVTALAKEGSLVDITVTTGATDTTAGWAQILTGYKPEISGVYSNKRLKPIPKGMTTLERARMAPGTDTVYTAMIVAKKQNLGSEAPHASFAGGPYYLSQAGMDLFVNDLQTNERVVNLVMQTIEKQKDKRFLMFVQFAEPDRAGHAHGEGSREYREAIKLNDASTGNIIAKLRDLGFYERSLVYVVSEHGFDVGQKNHLDAPNVFCATNDNTVKRNGDRADIAPTILKRFGVDLSTIAPPLSGTPLDGGTRPAAGR